MADASITHTLDVRDIDGEPFDAIMDELEALAPDEQLVLLAAFEPVPLYDVLTSRGFAHETTRMSDETYRVAITHD
jgi:uncharacterized protein (DUF2249 family)